MLQDLLGHLWKPLGRTSWYPGVIATSALIVGGWGYFLYQGVTDPQGGINSLWPLFGIANQLLATVALCVATTVIVKMRRTRYVWVTLLPMLWLTAATLTAGYQKMFSPNPRVGFLAHARTVTDSLGAGPVTAANREAARQAIRNDRVDAFVTGMFALMVIVILVDSLLHWLAIWSGRQEPVLHEAGYQASSLEAD
jgi:carbon starvation protein